jgi:hypothetical protein
MGVTGAVERFLEVPVYAIAFACLETWVRLWQARQVGFSLPSG